jgi:TspO/MBR family protein
MDKRWKALHLRTMVADEAFHSGQPVRHIRRDRGNTLRWQGAKRCNEEVASTAMGIPDARLVWGRILLLRDVFCGRVSHGGIKQGRDCSDADRGGDGCECRMESHFFRLHSLRWSFWFYVPYFVLVAALIRALWSIDRVSAILLVVYSAYLPYAFVWSYFVQKLNTPPSNQ